MNEGLNALPSNLHSMAFPQNMPEGSPGQPRRLAAGGARHQLLHLDQQRPHRAVARRQPLYHLHARQQQCDEFMSWGKTPCISLMRASSVLLSGWPAHLLPMLLKVLHKLLKVGHIQPHIIHTLLPTPWHSFSAAWLRLACSCPLLSRICRGARCRYATRLGASSRRGPTAAISAGSGAAGTSKGRIGRHQAGPSDVEDCLFYQGRVLLHLRHQSCELVHHLQCRRGQTVPQWVRT